MFNYFYSQGSISISPSTLPLTEPYRRSGETSKVICFCRIVEPLLLSLALQFNINTRIIYNKLIQIIKIQAIGQEDGLLVMIFVFQDIQEDCVKNVIDIIQEEMVNSIKISNNWIVNSVNSFQRGCQPFLISIWAIVSTLLTIRSIEKPNQLYVQLKLRQNQRFVEILFKLQLDHESILLKLLLNYFWIFSLIFTFNISFSISYNFVKPSTDTSYFMANYFECFLAEIQRVELIYSRILIMLGLMICQILFIFLGFQLLQILKYFKFQNRIISITVLYLYIQNFASLINQFFSILAVRRISDLNYIQGDVSLIYGSQNHISWIYGFVIPGSLLIGLILPLSLFLLLQLTKLNLLDIQSGQCCQIAIFLATVKYICEQQEKQNISFLLQLIIILDSIILGYPFIIDTLNVYYKKYKQEILLLLLTAFQILRPNFILTKFLRKKVNNFEIQDLQFNQRQKEDKRQNQYLKIEKNALLKQLTRLFTKKQQIIIQYKQWKTSIAQYCRY